MPVGPYKTFGQCVAAQKKKGKSDESARKICGKMEKQTQSDYLATLEPPEWLTDISQLSVAAANPHYLGIDLGQFSGLSADISPYFGLWAIHPDPFRTAVDKVNCLDIRHHVATYEAPEGALPTYTKVNSVAVVNLEGALMKKASSLGGTTSTVLVRKQIRDAAQADDIDHILLHIDSPGGQAAGTYELADEIAAAAKIKPVTGYIEDIGASAAYWAASRTSTLYANAASLSGGMGTYAVLTDTSEQADKLGVKVHVVKAGAFKGTGTPGTKVTEEQLDEVQRVVNGLNKFFLESVAQGRGMSDSEVAELADGRVHLGEAAVELGLIDGIRTFDEVLESLTSNMEVTVMAENNVAVKAAEPAPATIEQIKEKCVGATAEFILSMVEQKATAEKAMSEWMMTQQKTIEDHRQQIDAMVSSRANLGVSSSDLDNLKTATINDVDPITDWRQKVREHVRDGLTHREACDRVANEEPELREAYVAAVNA